ncbi:phosphate ABC transporter permease PstA [Bdellovibrio bacteriovorus]|uniref:Phosphate transport system permease protein PstA n=1 Tax=Bdellovibrio bacteriovorus str. Tiberius TaxID=1069642 RepID=K7Z9U3_BDEBC|nr:phosphate ABC transporter permease PstA [Bdellovibrio bacteriovorus]AFY01344.1 phosphate ABC transporter, permease protein [Bdellovibrio bacteriovorus str. Tiberius]
MDSRQELLANIKRRQMWDFAFALMGLLSLLFALVTLLALIVDLGMTGIPRINAEFFVNFPSRFAEKAGILSAWVGSFLIMVTTAVCAIPLGVAAGVYLEEYSKKNWVSQIIELNIINLAGIPSITYGLMALGLFVYKLKLGQSILTAGLTLGLLVLPIIIVTTREAIRAIPNTIREASYAMGASKWQTIRYHILPYSSGGILTGVIISLSRAIGETAPLITIGALTFIAFLPTPPIDGQFPYVNFTWLMDPFTVMPIQMFNWLSRPQPEFHVNAAATGVVLLVMTLIMNGGAIYLRSRFRKKMKW